MIDSVIIVVVEDEDDKVAECGAGRFSRAGIHIHVVMSRGNKSCVVARVIAVYMVDTD